MFRYIKKFYQTFLLQFRPSPCYSFTWGVVAWSCLHPFLTSHHWSDDWGQKNNRIDHYREASAWQILSIKTINRICDKVQHWQSPAPTDNAKSNGNSKSAGPYPKMVTVSVTQSEAFVDTVTISLSRRKKIYNKRWLDLAWLDFQYNWFHQLAIFQSLKIKNVSHQSVMETSWGWIIVETNSKQTSQLNYSIQNGKSLIRASSLLLQTVHLNLWALIRVIHPALCDPGLSRNVLCFSLRDNPNIWWHTAVVTWDLSRELDPFRHHRPPSLWIWITPNWVTLMMTCVPQSSLFRLIPAERISPRLIVWGRG